jgi:hypothetical protein
MGYVCIESSIGIGNLFEFLFNIEKIENITPSPLHVLMWIE